MSGDVSCVICFEPLSAGVIGATVPCGHCFHEECFRRWQASKANTSAASSAWYENHVVVKCPMCNKDSRSFCRLYIGFDRSDSTLKDNEDDCSLSSFEDNEEAEASHSTGKSNAKTGAIEIIEIRDDDDIETINRLNKYRAMAKRFKHRVKMVENQQLETTNQLKSLQTKFKLNKDSLEEVKKELENVNSNCYLNERELEVQKIDLARCLREIQELTDSLKSAISGKEMSDRMLADVRLSHAKELKKAQANTMSEVQKMLQEHPQLVRENRDLKQRIELYKKRLQEVSHPALRPGVKCERSDTTSMPSRTSQLHLRPLTKSTIMNLRQMSDLNSVHNSYQNEKKREADQHTTSTTKLQGKLSVHAARIAAKASTDTQRYLAMSSESLREDENDKRSMINKRLASSDLTPLQFSKKRPEASKSSRGTFSDRYHYKL